MLISRAVRNSNLVAQIWGPSVADGIVGDTIPPSVPTRESSRECRAKLDLKSHALALAPSALGLRTLSNVWTNASRNEKNTSTAYPTRNATACGDTETPWVKLLNRPTTVPAMSAIIKRARLE